MFDPIVRSLCEGLECNCNSRSCNSLYKQELYKQETDRQFRSVSFSVVRTRYHSRVFDYLAHPNLSAALTTDQKWPFKLPLYLSLKFSRVPFTLVLISLINTAVNGTLLNFGKRYKDGLRVIFDQWPKLHFDLDALSNQKILKGV